MKKVLLILLGLAVITGIGYAVFSPSSKIFKGALLPPSSPTLVVSLASNPASSTWVRGSVGVPFTGLNFACSNLSNCLVDSISLQGYIDDSGTADNWSTNGVGVDHSTSINSYIPTLSLEDSRGNVIMDGVPVSSTGAVTFSGLNWMINQGSTETLFVVGDLSINSYQNADGENIAFGLPSNTSVGWEDDNGVFLNQTGTPNNQTTGTTDPSTFVSTAYSGSLTLSVDSSTPISRPIIPGTARVEVSKFRFVTTGEDFHVRQLAINNKQSGINAANLGDYDNNVSRVIISYVNSQGQVEEKTGFLREGIVNFSGLDFKIAKDNSALITVYADINSLRGGATIGEFIELNLAFNYFEATALSSREIFTAAKIDATVDHLADLDFGSISFVNGIDLFELDGIQNPNLSLGAPLTLIIDDGLNNDNTNRLPAGAIICVDDNGSGTCLSEDIYIVRSVSVGSTEDTYTLFPVDDGGDDNYINDTPILYALPGTGFLTKTNSMVVN